MIFGDTGKLFVRKYAGNTSTSALLQRADDKSLSKKTQLSSYTHATLSKLL